MAPCTDAVSACNCMEKGISDFSHYPGEVWKVAGRGPEPNQPNAIITPRAGEEGGK